MKNWTMCNVKWNMIHYVSIMQWCCHKPRFRLCFGAIITWLSLVTTSMQFKCSKTLDCNYCIVAYYAISWANLDFEVMMNGVHFPVEGCMLQSGDLLSWVWQLSWQSVNVCLCDPQHVFEWWAQIKYNLSKIIQNHDKSLYSKWPVNCSPLEAKTHQITT